MSRLKSYIAEGEHQTQDFKFRVDDAKKIARTLAAFANTDGGRLLIGVKDNKKVVGINPEEEFHLVQGAAAVYCKPEVQIETEILNEKHKLVLVVNVLKSKEKIIKAKDENDRWKVYVRRDDHTLLANKILLGVWERKKIKKSIPQKFDESEKLVLDCIKENQPITLSKIYRKTKLNKGYIDKLMILYVSWGIAEMDLSEKGSFFYISETTNDVKL
ncbi:MAG: ATP-binding protein [Brumimicrobium sp.]